MPQTIAEMVQASVAAQTPSQDTHQAALGHNNSAQSATMMASAITNAAHPGITNSRAGASTRLHGPVNTPPEGTWRNVPTPAAKPTAVIENQASIAQNVPSDADAPILDPMEEVRRTVLTCANGIYRFQSPFHWREKITFDQFKPLMIDYRQKDNAPINMAYNAFSVGAEYSWSPVVARVLDGRIGNFLRGPNHPVAHFEPVEPIVRARLGYESGIPCWFFGDQQGLPNLNVAELERATQEYNNDIKHYSCCPHDINTPTPVTCDCFHIRAKYRQKRQSLDYPNKANILENVYAALEAAVKVLDDQDEWNPDSFIRRPRLPQPLPPLVEWTRDPVEAGIIPLELVGSTMNRCSTEGSGCIDTFLLHHTNGPEPRLTAPQRRAYESQQNYESAVRKWKRGYWLGDT
ncbi:hypothetical protein LTR22_017758 [Elasticomyces elasticus]|nr:hypothetical protein LTR22_017758 [Elasticomyces elasticus]KAK4913046.1 hypothetical protein LTR49_018604 [Elasticomyces elasticus]